MLDGVLTNDRHDLERIERDSASAVEHTKNIAMNVTNPAVPLFSQSFHSSKNELNCLIYNQFSLKESQRTTK